MTDFTMPSLGADMDAGKLIEWRVKPGDVVRRGDVVALVETQKGLVDIEIWQGGVVERLLIEPGSEVPVGTVLATLREPEQGRVEATEAAVPPIGSGVAAPRAPALEPSPATTTPEPHARAESGRVPSSPGARQLARELGLELAIITGTGPHGAITRADVAAAAARRDAALTPSPPPSPPVAQPLSGMRQAIAAAMARSKREIPHYYLSLDCDLSHTLSWLEAENATRSVADRLLLAALLLKATALAVREVPEMNGYLIDGAFRPSSSVHVGVGISLRQGGLIAPAIHDLDQLALEQVMRALSDLVQRARRGGLRSSELSDATITVTNLGDQGATSVFGVIYPPQVALVGFGKPTPRPWADNGMLGVRTCLTATLAADHRVSDGHRGAVFLSAIVRLLANPEKL